MKYKLVTFDKEAGWDQIESQSLVNFTAMLEVRGYTLTGPHENPRTRPELQGQPKFTNLAGPMYDGGVIRYENWPAYELLSA